MLIRVRIRCWRTNYRVFLLLLYSGCQRVFSLWRRTDGKGEDLWHSGPVELSPFSATTTLVVFELP